MFTVLLAWCAGPITDITISPETLLSLETSATEYTKEKLEEDTKRIIELSCKTRSGEDKFANFVIVENNQYYLTYLKALAHDSSLLNTFTWEQCTSEWWSELDVVFLVFDAMSKLMGFETLADPSISLEKRTTAVFAMSKLMQDQFGDLVIDPLKESFVETSVSFMRWAKLFYIAEDTTLLERKGFTVEPEIMDALYTMLARQLNHRSELIQSSAISGLGSLQYEKAKELLKLYVDSVSKERGARAKLELQLNYSL